MYIRIAAHFIVVELISSIALGGAKELVTALYESIHRKTPTLKRNNEHF